MPSRISMGTVVLVMGVAVNSYAQPLLIVDDLPGVFVDISDGSNALMLGDDDEVEIIGSGSAMGNVVFPLERILVANNGGLGFRDPLDTDLAPLNEPIPSNNAFGGGQAALAFWDDIDDKFGDVFFSQFEDRTIVQWNDRNIAGTADTVRFQIQIFEGAGPGGIVAQYLFDDIEQPGSGGGLGATIGYQDGGTGFGDVLWSFDTADAVSDGMVLSLVLTPEPSTLMLLVLGGMGLMNRRSSSIGHRRTNRPHRRPASSERSQRFLACPRIHRA